MAQVSRPNGIRTRRTMLVNPYRKARKNARRLTMAQKLAGFGGKRMQAAAMGHKPRTNAGKRMRDLRKDWESSRTQQGLPRRRRSASKASYRYRMASSEKRGRGEKAPYYRKNSAPRRRTRRARKNVSAILTAGLPFMNPARKRKRTNMATSTKRKSYRRRASSHTAKRRRPRTNAHWTRKHRARTNFSFFSHKPRRRRRSAARRNPAVVYRYRKARKMSRRNGRRNPGTGGEIKNLVINAAWAGVGAIGSRSLTQLLAGSYNTSFTGYGLNAVAGALLAWGAGKFAGKNARNYVLVGTALGVLLRMLNDLTPWGSQLALSGFGDSGMGALVPLSFTQPAIWNDNGSLRVPAAYRQVAAPNTGGLVNSRTPATATRSMGQATSAYGAGRSAYGRR